MSKASVFRVKYLFKKYMDNACSMAELEELFDFIGQEEHSQELKELLEQLWLNTPLTTQQEMEAQVQQLRYQKLMGTIKSEKKTYSFERKRVNWIGLEIAASLLIIITIAAYFYTRPGAKLQATFTAAPIGKKTPAYVRIVKLPDGSTVMLNKGSKLDYPASFTGTQRKVTLTGEAYFDIKHDSKHPFVVYADGVVTKVLGTAFNVKAAGGSVSVTVTRGKVSVSANKKLLGILLPDQQISYSRTTHRSSQININAQTSILWKEPDLILDNISLKEAAVQLSEHYGINVKLEGPQLENCRFSATFLNTTRFEQVLEVISALNNLDVKQEDEKTFMLSGPGCN